MFENLKNGRERKKNALEHIKWENIAPSEQITIVKYQMKEVLFVLLLHQIFWRKQRKELLFDYHQNIKYSMKIIKSCELTSSRG